MTFTLIVWLLTSSGTTSATVNGSYLDLKECRDVGRRLESYFSVEIAGEMDTFPRKIGYTCVEGRKVG